MTLYGSREPLWNCRIADTGTGGCFSYRFDNVDRKDNSPRITTVDCDRETMGYRACEYLMTKTAKRYKSFVFKYRLGSIQRVVAVKEKDRTMAEK